MTIELLTPPPARELPRARRAADRAELLGLSPEPARSPRRRRRWFAGLGAFGLVAAGGGVAFAVVALQPEPATIQDSARCYSEVAKDFTRDFPGVGVSFVPDAGDPESTDVRARDLCAQMWRTGVLPDPSREPVPGAPPADVPPLVACVLPDGQVGVFPGFGPDLCNQLGIPPLLEA